MKVISPMKTWKLRVREDRVVDPDGFSTFEGMSVHQVETFCMSRGWIVRKA